MVPAGGLDDTVSVNHSNVHEDYLESLKIIIGSLKVQCYFKCTTVNENINLDIVIGVSTYDV